MTSKFPKPKVLVSKCLGFAPCRWNGDIINDEHVKALRPFVEFLPVCPEVEIGLGIPRKPVRLVETKGRVSLVQPDTGREFSKEMAAFCKKHLQSLPRVDGFILKSRSPSCGPVDVAIYFGTQRGAGSRRDAGIFGGMIKVFFPDLAQEHEGRLKNFTIREHFYTKLFTLARFRKVRAKGNMASLVEFQAANKLLFMAWNQSQAKVLGRICANPERIAPADVFDKYAHVLPKVMARPIRRPAAINALMHAMGYFSKSLTSGEKAHFLGLLDDYRNGKAPLSAPQALLTSWVMRFDEPYLKGQSFFAPYPARLVEISDSGKGRSR